VTGPIDALQKLFVDRIDQAIRATISA